MVGRGGARVCVRSNPMNDDDVVRRREALITLHRTASYLTTTLPPCLLLFLDQTTPVLNDIAARLFYVYKDRFCFVFNARPTLNIMF